MAVDNYWGQQNQQGQQGQPAQQPAQPPQPVQQFVQPETTTSLGGWVLNLFLVAIPVVGLVMLFVWAFGSTPDESKRNWARANLVWLLVGAVLCAVVFLVAGVSLTSLYSVYSS